MIITKTLKMKLFYTPLLIVFFLNFVSIDNLMASSGNYEEKIIDEKEQKEASIYSLNFKISPELTTEGNFGRVSWSRTFSDEIKNSIKKLAESKCKEKLNAKTNCIYKKNKKGKELSSLGGSGTLSGMPSNTFKNAVATNEKDFYIKLDFYITNDGKPILVGKKKSVIKPRVVAYVKVFDKDKNVIFSNKLTRNTFEGLIDLNEKDEPLSPENSYKIFEAVLTELMQD